MYTTLDTAAPILTATDRILSLASPTTIDMGGIKLTGNAIPITMAGVAYILDKASDGSTVLYSLNPSQGAKLQRVSIQSDVPPFSVNIAAAAVSSKIVIYGASNNGIATATFNAFDTVAGVWTGPGLVKAMTVTSPSGSSPSNGSDGSGGKSGKSSIGGIVGGVVGGLVVVALIAFLFIRHRRNSKKGNTSSAAAGAGSAGVETVAVPRPNIVYDGKHDNYPQAASPPMQQNYISGVPPQFQQQQQQQQYNAHHSYIPQSFSMDPSKDAYIAASPHQLQPQQNPMIFQAQQQPMYSYAPPILTTVPQPHQPQIFQPQNDAASDPSYSHAIYTSSASGSTPHTPYTPANQVHTPSTATASSPQYMPSSNQGYVS
ncbi:hypothetical protein BGZ98_007523 [Dissophora globulifera]|nr:hypothetical protein BGZ98_007523 [Dissophora globulifera]